MFDLSRLGPGQFHFDTAILGGVSTGRQRVNVAYTGYARTSESYIAWVNTRGRPVYQQGNLHYASESDQIVTYRPGLLPQVATLDVGTELTYLALQPWMLERHLEILLEHQISGPIELAPLARMRAGGTGLVAPAADVQPADAEHRQRTAAPRRHRSTVRGADERPATQR